MLASEKPLQVTLFLKINVRVFVPSAYRYIDANESNTVGYLSVGMNIDQVVGDCVKL